MMTPHMAEDIIVLEQYLTSQPSKGSITTTSYKTISNTTGDPIVYLTVPRMRKGLRSSTDPAKIQREIIEQVLSPFTDQVRTLYFDQIHPCFPIVDKKTFQDMWREDKDRISSALLCDMYAVALSFWRCSEALSPHSRPDDQFVWNQAVIALQDDFMAPKISTVHAALLDLLGRPVMQVNGNILNAGRVVNLAQSLGLHRDPHSWKATAHEKDARIRLWWGVLTQDYWSSLSYGIPPTVNSRYHDVPLPTGNEPSTGERGDGVAQSFVQLCGLTQILGNVLPLVYSIRLDVEEVSRSLRRVECELDDWKIKLPGILDINTPGGVGTNGASNLWFCFLAIKVLVCRLAYKSSLQHPTSVAGEARNDHLANMRIASSEVAEFFSSVTDSELRGFWLPYTSYLLSTAAITLLRCTIECHELETRRSCATTLVRFKNRLREASEQGWDLADYCLERCAQPIDRIAESLHVLAQASTTSSDNASNFDTTSSSADPVVTDSTASLLDPMLDFVLPMDSLDYPWETIWHDIQEAGFGQT